MRDRTASRRYSAERDEFRRDQQRRCAWGLTQRHAHKLRHLQRAAEAAAASATETCHPEPTKAAQSRNPVHASPRSPVHAPPAASMPPRSKKSDSRSPAPPRPATTSRSGTGTPSRPTPAARSAASNRTPTVGKSAAVSGSSPRNPGIPTRAIPSPKLTGFRHEEPNSKWLISGRFVGHDKPVSLSLAAFSPTSNGLSIVPLREWRASTSTRPASNNRSPFPSPASPPPNDVDHACAGLLAVTEGPGPPRNTCPHGSRAPPSVLSAGRPTKPSCP